MINNELPKWARIGQIILGVLSIILSGVVLMFPTIVTLSLVIILSAVLIIVGIEKVTISYVRGRRKLIDMGLGIAVIAIGIAAIAFPLAATLVFIALIAFGLLFDGISRIIEGVIEKTRHRWNRAINIGTGIVSIFLSTIIIAMPFMGEIFISLLIAFALLITGLVILTSGLYGNRIMRNTI
ncbi:MAG: DUF308 domain-containing protein [Candidatus Nitrosocosmicus sp.]|nr:DUF308 domain-containing protein [Candidatus Nitrosocosmicus sp.]